MPDNKEHRKHEHGTPSATEGANTSPDPIIEDDRSDGRPDRPIYGSEGSGGDTTPARPLERKRRTGP
jgi:hypothetical protein